MLIYLFINYFAATIYTIHTNIVQIIKHTQKNINFKRQKLIQMKKKNFPPISQWTILHTPLGFTQSSLEITKVTIKS